MKQSLLIWTLSTLVVAALVHVAFMFIYPNVIMGVAIKRLSREGTAENVWLHSPRMTEDVRVIVRPSPDLAYSSCVYNLSEGPVAFRVAPWGDYMSL